MFNIQIYQNIVKKLKFTLSWKEYLIDTYNN